MSSFTSGAVTVLFLLAGGLLAAADGRPNLAANPSFELGAGRPEGWEVFAPPGAVPSRDVTVAHSGRASAGMVIDEEGAREYPAFKFRVTGVRPGEEYWGRAWARTEGMTELGAYVVIEFYQGEDRLSFAQGDFTGAGTHDWRELVVRAIVPVGADSIRLGLVAHGRGKVWFDDAQLVPTQEAPVPFDGTEVSLRVRPEQVLCRRFHGFGAQGDFFLTRRINTDRGVTAQDRELVLRRVEKMRPAIIRTFFDYKWWEPEEGRHTPDSEAMRDYLLWVRFLKSIGTSVLLCPWGDCFAYCDWMRSGGAKLPAPEKREAMIRSLVDLVQFLRRDQGLDNVKYLCLMNEPDNDPTRAVPPDEFVRLYRLLDTMLRERGLRREMFVLGADDCSGGPTEASPWFREIVARGVEYCDGLSAHTYKHEYVPGLAPWVRERLHLLRGSRRPLFITEFGYTGAVMDTFQNPENVKYEYGLFLGDFAIMALQERVSAALTWCLMDTYYDDVHCQGYGLWRYRDANWGPRPGFYAWSLVTRYTRVGSRVVAVEVSPAAHDVRAVALLSPKGELTVLAANRYHRPLRASLQVGLKRRATLRAYRYARDNVPVPGGGMIEAQEVLPATPGSAVSLDLPAESFVLLSEVQ